MFTIENDMLSNRNHMCHRSRKFNNTANNNVMWWSHEVERRISTAGCNYMANNEYWCQTQNWVFERIENIAKVSDVTKKSGKVTNIFLLYLLPLLNFLFLQYSWFLQACNLAFETKPWHFLLYLQCLQAFEGILSSVTFWFKTAVTVVIFAVFVGEHLAILVQIFVIFRVTVFVACWRAPFYCVTLEFIALLHLLPLWYMKVYSFF